eukprot:2551290-Amphidinium_carterae.1
MLRDVVFVQDNDSCGGSDDERRMTSKPSTRRAQQTFDSPPHRLTRALTEHSKANQPPIKHLPHGVH